MPFLATILWFFFSFLVAFYIWSIFKKRQFKPRCTIPTGPPGHWLLGHLNLPFARLSPSIFEWRKEYGPIFEFWIIPKFSSASFIVLNDMKLVKELLMNKDFASRDHTANGATLMMNPERKGIASQDWNLEWKELHKFTTSSLSSMGFGRLQMEDKMLSEADALVEVMLKTNGMPFEPEHMIRIAVSNVVSNAVFNERCDIGKPSRIHEALQDMMHGFLFFIKHPIYTIFPSMIHWYLTKQAKKIKESTDFVDMFIKKSITYHEQTIDPDDVRDLIDVFILERRNNPEAGHLSFDNMSHTIFDLFAAGTDTTTQTLNWTIAWLLHYPDVHTKLTDELNAVLGTDGVPTFSMLKDLHYLHAFMDEVLRKSTVADFTVPHRCTKPVVDFAGYKITNDKIIMPNIWACHHDASLWKDPDAFNPERFLDEHRRHQKNENLMAFGVGPRRCLGERLARLEQFIFTVRLLQRLGFEIPAGFPLPDMSGRKPLVRAPGFYSVCVTPTS